MLPAWYWSLTTNKMISISIGITRPKAFVKLSWTVVPRWIKICSPWRSTLWSSAEGLIHASSANSKGSPTLTGAAWPARSGLTSTSLCAGTALSAGLISCQTPRRSILKVAGLCWSTVGIPAKSSTTCLCLRSSLLRATSARSIRCWWWRRSPSNFLSPCSSTMSRWSSTPPPPWSNFGLFHSWNCSSLKQHVGHRLASIGVQKTQQHMGPRSCQSSNSPHSCTNTCKLLGSVGFVFLHPKLVQDILKSCPESKAINPSWLRGGCTQSWLAKPAVL